MASAIYPSLTGRVAIVTGGASGIGDSIVRAFAKVGSRVAILDIDDAAAARQADEMRDAGLEPPLYKHCDLTDINALRATLAAIRATLGPASVLVNNGADDARVPFDAVTVEDFDRAMNVNLRHVFFASQAVAGQMRELGRGSIINMSSGAWVGGFADLQGYSAAKAAVVGLTNSLARQLGGDRIRVNAIAPGAVLTERQLRLWMKPDDLARVIDQQCLKDHVEPADVADAALFFAADESRMITKQCLFVNAGLR